MNIGIPRDSYLKVIRLKELRQEIRYNTKTFDHCRRMQRSNKGKQKAQVKNRYQKGNWIKNIQSGASLVVQWWRIWLPVQETRVRSLIREDRTCSRATKPTAMEPVLQPGSLNYWSPRAPEPLLSNKRSRFNEKPAHHK